MKKAVVFVDADKKLINKIEKYQHEKGLSSFVAAVRQLCENSLNLNEIIK